MKLIHQDFLQSEDKYIKCEKYWETLFEEFNSQLEPSKQWSTWFENVYGNGSKMMDGNPIFLRINSENKRAVRIIQEEAEEVQFHIAAWLDKFDDRIDELVISCIPSDEVEPRIKKILFYYVILNLEGISMQKVIDETVGCA